MKSKPPTCAGCPAAQVGRGFVPAEGPKDAAIALVGQGPGEQEADLGRPFVGQSGFSLDRWLVRSGVQRHECHVSNVVWCWLPNNRPPSRAEVEHCRAVHWGPALHQLTQLKIVVPIGVPSMKAILGPKATAAWAGVVSEVEL